LHSKEDHERWLAAGRERKWDNDARRSIHDKRKLAWAARLFRHALAAGLVDADGNVLDEPERRNGDADAERKAS
jgi:hypothetical protein